MVMLTPMQFPTLDGESTWIDTINVDAIPELDKAITATLQALNKVNANKTFNVGLTYGLQSYLNILKRANDQTRTT